MDLNSKLLELKNICINNNIPIIRDNTLDLILDWIKNNDIYSILEIGTAYGYSSLAFSMNEKINFIETIEKNFNNYKIAIDFISPLKIEKLNLLNIDAFEYETNKKFDLIFIDGPKSNQIKLFNKYLHFLSDNGVIFIDNLYLNKIRNIPEESKTNSQKNIIKKVDEFVNYLKSQKSWKFELIDIDDGVGIVKKYE